MDRILRFVNFYPVSLFIALIAFFNQWIAYLYFIAYFGLIINLFLGQEQIVADPERSATSHFEIKSRYNWVNYALSAYTIASAVIFYFLPINKVALIFVLWTVLAASLFWLLRNYRRYYILQLTCNYILGKAPQLDPKLVMADLIELLKTKENLNYAAVSINAEVSQYAQIYWERNFTELV